MIFYQVRKNLCHHVAMGASIGKKLKGMMDNFFAFVKAFQTFKTSVISHLQPPYHVSSFHLYFLNS